LYRFTKWKDKLSTKDVKSVGIKSVPWLMTETNNDEAAAKNAFRKKTLVCNTELFLLKITRLAHKHLIFGLESKVQL